MHIGCFGLSGTEPVERDLLIIAVRAVKSCTCTCQNKEAEIGSMLLDLIGDLAIILL